MVQRRNNGTWRLQYTDSMGNLKSASFKRKTDADAFAEKVRRERQLLRAGLELPKESDLLLDDSARYLKKRVQSEKKSTMDSEKRNITWFIEKHGLKPTRSITTKIIRDFLDEIQLERGWNNATRNRCRSYLHIMFEQFFQDERVMINPVSRIPVEKESPKRKVPLTPEQATQFISAASDPMRRLFATILTYQGPRVSEAVALETRDFDLEHGFLHIRRIWEQVSGETHERLKGRPEGIVVPLLPIVRLALDQYVAHYGKPAASHRIFRDRDGKPASVYTGKSWVKTLAKHSGIGRSVSPHDLRATFASLAEEAGMPKEIIQKLMGHSSITVTERYVTRRSEQIKSAVLGTGFGALSGARPVRLPGAGRRKKIG